MNRQLRTTHWQLSPDINNLFSIDGLDDIHVCINNILNIIKGSDVLRPEFGSEHFRYLDQPEDVAIANIVREVIVALQRWEKRIEIISVKVNGQAPHFHFLIEWALADDVYRQLYTTTHSPLLRTEV